MKLRARKMLALGVLLMLTACATIAPPQPPSLELPKPVSDLRAVRKGDRVTLTWTVPTATTDRQTLRSVGTTRICRGLGPELTECGEPVGDVAPTAIVAADKPSRKKATASFTELVTAQGDDLFGFANYAVEVLNASGRGAGLSNQVRVPLAATLAPPQDFAAQISDEGVRLTWSGAPLSLSLPFPNPVRRSYRVFRRAEDSQQQVLVGELEAGAEPRLSLADKSFEWEKTYYYHADTLTVLAQTGKPEVQIAGDDTAEVKVFAHDVFPPAVPSGVQAVFSGPGQRAFIDLIWAPAADVDLDGYNVYRHEAGAAAVKVNAELVRTPAYRDASVVSGKSYLYSVTAVDVRGNESGRSEESGESVP